MVPTNENANEGQPERSNRVFVGCLSKNTTDESLYTLFGGLAGFVSSKVVEDKQTGQCRGYGFLVFSTVELAEECIKIMDGVELDGRFINVKWCISKAVPNGPEVRAEPARRPAFQLRGQVDHATQDRRRPGVTEQAFAVKIFGLPSDTVWTELKDFLRTIGDVQFVKVNSDGTALARYCHEQDMLNAVASLNGSRYRGARISIVEEASEHQVPSGPYKRPMPRDHSFPGPGQRQVRPHPNHVRDGYYPCEREGLRRRVDPRYQQPYPRYGYADEGLPYEYDVVEYENDGYYGVDYMYEGGDVYEKYAMPVYRGESGRPAVRRGPASRGVAYW